MSGYNIDPHQTPWINGEQNTDTDARPQWQPEYMQSSAGQLQTDQAENIPDSDLRMTVDGTGVPDASTGWDTARWYNAQGYTNDQTYPHPSSELRTFSAHYSPALGSEQVCISQGFAGQGSHPQYPPDEGLDSATSDYPSVHCSNRVIIDPQLEMLPSIPPKSADHATATPEILSVQQVPTTTNTAADWSDHTLSSTNAIPAALQGVKPYQRQSKDNQRKIVTSASAAIRSAMSTTEFAGRDTTRIPEKKRYARTSTMNDLTRAHEQLLEIERNGFRIPVDPSTTQQPQFQMAGLADSAASGEESQLQLSKLVKGADADTRIQLWHAQIVLDENSALWHYQKSISYVLSRPPFSDIDYNSTARTKVEHACSGLQAAYEYDTLHATQTHRDDLFNVLCDLETRQDDDADEEYRTHVRNIRRRLQCVVPMVSG
ncbi:hypothetical protein IAT40_004247 [Kwoniella sp. CBS 6097]